MIVDTLDTIQRLPVTSDTMWAYISTPVNLRAITPPRMDFRITSGEEPGRMYAGQIITYRVRVLPGVRVTWVTEITHVKDGEYFVDEQRFGPYRMWHHAHFLRAIEGGVEMRDRVHYVLPFGPLGRLGAWFVKRELQGIFRHRREVLERLFGPPPPENSDAS